MSEVTLTRAMIEGEIARLKLEGAASQYKVEIATLALERRDMDLAARDAEVTRMALERAAEISQKIIQGEEYIEPAIEPNFDDPENIEIGRGERKCRVIKFGTISSAILALKSTPTRLQEVPEAYVVAPVEPTEAMLTAGADENTEFNGHSTTDLKMAAKIYRAMLAAVTVKP